MQFELELLFTTEQLDTIFPTGSKVILAKPTAQQKSPEVAWQAFSPLESNKVTWEEQYGIYASTTAMEHGVTLTQKSRTAVPAVDGKNYEFKESGAFDPPEGVEAKHSFFATNNYAHKPCLTIGLFQDAIVNGEEVPGNAISGAEVLRGSQAKMTPYTTVYVWLQSDVESNTVVSHMTSKPTKVTFGGDITEIELAYDSATGLFISPN
jgi:hypothetical protein